MMIDEAAIKAALAQPELFADVLAGVFNHRGQRDAAMAITARTGGWEQLRVAAEVALMHAAMFGEASVHGPATVLGAVAWVAPDGLDPRPLWAAVPASDPAHHLASLILRLHDKGMPVELWTERLAVIDIPSCLAFVGEPRVDA